MRSSAAPPEIPPGAPTPSGVARLRRVGSPTGLLAAPASTQNDSNVFGLDNSVFIGVVVAVALMALIAVVWSRRG